MLVLHADYVTTLLQTLTGTGNLCVRVHRKGFSFLRGMNFLTHRHKVGPESADSQVDGVDRESKRGQRG